MRSARGFGRCIHDIIDDRQMDAAVKEKAIKRVFSPNAFGIRSQWVRHN